MLGMDCTQEQKFHFWKKNFTTGLHTLRVSKYLTSAVENTGQADSSFLSKVFLLNSYSGLFQTLWGGVCCHYRTGTNMLV